MNSILGRTLGTMTPGALHGNSAMSRALCALLPVFHLCFCNRLPLHVARRVGAASAEWHDVVHDVTGPATRVSAATHKVVFCRATARNSPMRVGRGMRPILRCRVAAGVTGCCITPGRGSRVGGDVCAIAPRVTTDMRAAARRAGASALCGERRGEGVERQDREEQPIQSHTPIPSLRGACATPHYS